MTDNPLRRPEVSVGDKWDLKNEGQSWLGCLFLIIPKSLEPNWKSPNNTYEPTDKITADVIMVTGPTPGKAWIDTFILSKTLVAILRDKLGDPVPGVLAQKQTANGLGWILQDAQTDAEWDAMCAQVMPVYNAYQQGQFKRATPSPASAGQGSPASQQSAGGWGQLPPAPATPQAGWNAPPSAPPAAATPAPYPGAALSDGGPSTGDPTADLLINKGLARVQVQAMQPEQRAAIAATYQ